jgi:hypothetical protein
LRGRYCLALANDLAFPGENANAARALFEQALNIDPDNADALAGGAKRLVDDDPCKPSPETGLTAEGVEIAEGAEVGLLQRVFSLAIVPHDAACDTLEPAVLLLDDQPDRRAVVLTRAFNELGLVWLRLWKSILGHLDIQ